MSWYPRRAAQEAWDGRTPLDDGPPDEHEYTGEVWLGKDEEFRFDFTNGGIDALTIIEPNRVREFNLEKLIDEADAKAMELWLEDMAARADDGDRYDDY